MKKYYLFFISLLFTLNYFSQNSFDYSVDLSDCNDDRLNVKLSLPVIKDSVVVFRLPKIVPGTYEIYNFGKFVSNFKAYDKNGKSIVYTRIDKNSWEIKNAQSLASIEYSVDDTWDSGVKESFVFEPAGSNFESGENFVLNTHCLFGYIEGYTNSEFKIKMYHPKEFFGACSLMDAITTDSVDTYKAASYMDLQDAPMMYCIPDTATLKIGGADILISLYSPNKVTSSNFIAENISEILESQKAYLGGELPIKKYVYLIYLSPNVGGSGASGALEHSYSSLYFLPEMPPQYLAQTIKDVSAHEFFHIVTPLNIHSEEIGTFDYNNPKMSKHLWLYEGVTEYSSLLVQVKYGKMPIEDFLKVIEDKIYAAKSYYDSIPFTEMSLGCLDKYKSQYGNVYEKGALIGLCLDIALRNLSKGKYGIQNLMQDLSLQYGKNKSFIDDELFDKIVELTYPEIKNFLNNYVAGTTPLPIENMLMLAGIAYKKNEAEKYISFGGYALAINPETNRLMVSNAQQMDTFGKAIGLEDNDELIKFNGRKITIENAQVIINDYLENAKEGDLFKMEVYRKVKGSNKFKKKKLQQNVFLVVGATSRSFEVMNSSSSEQIELRKAWLGK